MGNDFAFGCYIEHAVKSEHSRNTRPMQVDIQKTHLETLLRKRKSQVREATLLFPHTAFSTHYDKFMSYTRKFAPDKFFLGFFLTAGAACT